MSTPGKKQYGRFQPKRAYKARAYKARAYKKKGVIVTASLLAHLYPYFAHRKERITDGPTDQQTLS